VGYADEGWWSRVAQPKMQSWSEAGQPLRLQELQVSKEDPDPKALSCYGLLEPESKTIRLRFVDGGPVSHVTTAFLEWLCQQLQQQGQRVLVLIWDHASWHVSKEVRSWLQQHNRGVLTAEREGQPGVRIIACWLPTKSPWLNRIEPHWVHGKRAIVEPARLLTAQEVEGRVSDYFACPVLDHLAQQVS
jgi:DDE superfamily endonuclease